MDKDIVEKHRNTKSLRKKMIFRKAPVPDLTPYVLNTNFQKFSLPDHEVANEFSTINLNVLRKQSFTK